MLVDDLMAEGCNSGGVNNVIRKRKEEFWCIKINYLLWSCDFKVLYKLEYRLPVPSLMFEGCIQTTRDQTGTF